jgi:hypothetical protein
MQSAVPLQANWLSAARRVLSEFYEDARRVDDLADADFDAASQQASALQHVPFDAPVAALVGGFCISGEWDRRTNCYRDLWAGSAELRRALAKGALRIFGRGRTELAREFQRERISSCLFATPVCIARGCVLPCTEAEAWDVYQRGDAIWTDLKLYTEEVLALWPAPTVDTAEGRTASRDADIPRGRSFRADDAPLVNEMRQLIKESKARSVTEAARIVVPQAKGTGSDESTVKRLERGYRARLKRQH